MSDKHQHKTQNDQYTPQHIPHPSPFSNEQIHYILKHYSRITLLIALIMFALVALVYTTTPSPTRAATCDVSGSIPTNVTWNSTDCDYYIVTGNVYIATDATLTIEAGTTIQFNKGTNITVHADGTLKALGTAVNPVIFTSNSSTASPGDWGYIIFEQSTDATFDEQGTYTGGSMLQHSIIEYAGADDNPALRLEGSSPWIDHVRIMTNKTDGIYANGSASTISNSTIADNGTHGIRASNSLLTIKHNTISHNNGSGISVENSAINIEDNVISQNTVAGDGGGIHVVNNCACGATIMNNTIDYNTAGGHGGGILASTATGTITISNNLVSNNTAGGRGGGISAASVRELVMKDNNVRSNTATFDGGGIWMYSESSYTIVNNTITHNTATATDAQGGGVYVGYVPFNKSFINDNSIYDNSADLGSDFAVSFAHNDTDLFAENNWWGTADTNGIESRIYHSADDATLATVDYTPPITSLCNVSPSITTDTTWSSDRCTAYIVTESVTVGPTATLTIQAGTMVKFNKDTSLTIDGTLKVLGENNNPVYFTSNSSAPAKGDWGGIFFPPSSTGATLFDTQGAYSDGSIIQNAVIWYAGVTIGSNLWIDRTVILDSLYDGIFTTGGALNISNSTIRNSGQNGIYCFASDATISNNG